MKELTILVRSGQNDYDVSSPSRYSPIPSFASGRYELLQVDSHEQRQKYSQASVRLRSPRVSVPRSLRNLSWWCFFGTASSPPHPAAKVRQQNTNSQVSRSRRLHPPRRSRVRWSAENVQQHSSNLQASFFLLYNKPGARVRGPNGRDAPRPSAAMDPLSRAIRDPVGARQGRTSRACRVHGVALRQQCPANWQRRAKREWRPRVAAAKNHLARHKNIRPGGNDIRDVGLVDAAIDLGRREEPASSRTARTRRSLSRLCGMKAWPEKPGFTDMTSTKSTSAATASSMTAGVAGLSTTPAVTRASR